MLAVIYARFSSSSQREESIEGQIRICKEYAQRNNIAIIDSYCDRAISGKTDNRPAFKKLLANSKKHLFDIVLVYSIDRFGRNLEQTLANQNRLEENGVKIVSVTENFTDGPSGRFFRNVMMSYAQFYSDEQTQTIKRGMDENGTKCLSTGGNIALGFKVGTDKHFEIDPNTAPIVQLIFELYADGKTVTQIATHLNSLGYKTSRGVAFNKNSLHTILKNKRYIGIYTYKGKETPGGMPRIISDELFYKVAEIMEKNRKAPARAKAKTEYLLTTKLFCGHCKEMMTGYSATGKQGKTYNYYVCNGKKNKVCSKKMVKKGYIEDLVVLHCRKLLTTVNIEKIAKEIVALCEAERDISNLRYLRKCLSDNERRHENALDAVLETDAPKLRASLYERISQLEKEHEQLEKEIAVEEAPFPSLTVPKIRFFLSSLKNGNVNDLKYRRTLISIFVNKIFLYDDRMTITLNSGDETVTINERLLSEIEERDMGIKNLFLAGNGPPKSKPLK